MLPSRIPKVPPIRARVKNVLSGMRHPASLARCLSNPIRTKPSRPERVSQPNTMSQVAFKPR